MGIITKEAMSDFNCNIASGVILEKIRDDEKLKIDGVLYVNFKTLWRNFVNCINGNTVEKTTMLTNHILLNSILELFLSDCSMFFIGCDGLNFNDIRVYYHKYGKIRSQDCFKDPLLSAGFKSKIEETTPIAYSKFSKFFKGLIYDKDKLVKGKGNTYFMTNLVVDLLPFSYDKNVLLLESHTGTVKDYKLWSSKYKKLPKLDMSFLPFNDILYSVYGDEEMINPYNIKYRKELYELLLKAKVKENTTRVKTLSIVKQYDKGFKPVKFL